MTGRNLTLLIIALIVIIAIWYFYKAKKAPQIPPQVPKFGHRTKTSGCIVRGPLPDPDCTPGAIISSVTKEQVCTPGYTKFVRNVPADLKDEVYAEYEITHHSPGEFEVDHHISLELGGSNDIANLWPEAAEPRPGYHEKDKVENYLHKQVCDGKMSLEEAQRQIATNWLEVYERIPKTTRHKKK